MLPSRRKRRSRASRFRRAAKPKKRANNSDRAQSYIRDDDFLKLADPAGKAYGYTLVASKWIESKGADYPAISARSEARTSSFFEVPGDYTLKLSGWTFEIRNKEYVAAEPASFRFILK